MLSVATWPAPCRLADLTSFGSLAGVRAAPGHVLVVRLAPDDTGRVPLAGGQSVTEGVRELRQRHPGSPLALWIRDAPPQTVIEVVRAASGAQVRAILGGDVLDPELLRSQLTQPCELSAFVLRWALDAGYLPDGVELEDLRDLLDAAPEVRTLERLSLRRRVAARTWRNRLQQLGLPAPRAWLALAHSLHVAFFMQRNRAEPLQVLCSRRGMRLPANLGQQFKRVFGLSPSQVRALLGAEPLLDRWFQAQLPRCRRGARA
jgi:hypothetical protein